MSWQALAETLARREISLVVCATGAEATDYLRRHIQGKTVGMGGSMTLKTLGVYEALAPHNEIYWHWNTPPGDLQRAQQAQVYLSSLNALARTGELVNIDGAGNRIAATCWQKEAVYFVIGKNKVTEDYAAAVHRARNVAAPLNARRLGAQTPCAKAETPACFDCSAPGRICRGMLTLLEKPTTIGAMTVLLVEEDLGY